MSTQNQLSILEEKIKSKKALVGVIGLGYVGLPLIHCARNAGYPVVGIDRFISPTRKESVEADGISVNQDFSAVKDCDVLLLCVPTPLDEGQQPDLSSVRSAAGDAARNFGDGEDPKLVVLESTSYPGTTREVLVPIFNDAGVEVGTQVKLAYSPERVDPGTDHRYEDIPRIVGGLDPESGNLAAEFYRNLVVSVKMVAEPETAEMAKLLENIFRAVNIALVNELSILCRRMDIDIWEVLEAAATKPFGFMPFKPGPGLGGHCIPIDPFYLAWKARKYDFYPEFIELAGKVNRNMPYHVVDWISEALNQNNKSISNSQVLLIGMAYKENVSDLRESPALKVMELVLEKGANVKYHDSFVDYLKLDGKDYHSVKLDKDILESSDCIVILTAHKDLETDLISSANVPIVDTRNVLKRGGH